MSVVVDKEHFDYLNKWKWYAHKSRNTFYAERTERTVSGKRILVQMHHEIIGKKEGLVVDHVNGNGLDNRRENLRLITNRQNTQNRHTERDSKYPGVGWSKYNKKWCARIRINNDRLHLGYFINEADAYRAYCDASKEITGDDVIFQCQGVLPQSVREFIGGMAAPEQFIKQIGGSCD